MPAFMLKCLIVTNGSMILTPEAAFGQKRQLMTFVTINVLSCLFFKWRVKMK